MACMFYKSSKLLKLQILMQALSKVGVVIQYAEATFLATCVPTKDGRPYIPEQIKSLL